MLDTVALFSALLAKIDNDGSLTSIHSKVYTDVVPAAGEGGPSRPFGKLELSGDPVEFKCLGSTAMFEKQRVKITITSSGGNDGNTLCTALQTVFHRQALSLTGFMLCDFITRSGKFIGKTPSEAVYESSVSFDFFVQS